nr:hypothetical protein JVH1_6846 [Rhodococcus sp. JVH1]
MSRRQLGDLVERLAVRQAALVERRRYTQRGGERMPGGRGGIFRQKITDAERVLATVLHLRQLCTRAVLAELFQVSPRTIGNALLDVRPLLEQDGYTPVPVPAPTRYRTRHPPRRHTTARGRHTRIDTLIPYSRSASGKLATRILAGWRRSRARDRRAR